MVLGWMSSYAQSPYLYQSLYRTPPFPSSSSSSALAHSSLTLTLTLALALALSLSLQSALASTGATLRRPNTLR